VEFGAHVSSAGGIDTAIDRIAAIGGDCVQIFTQSPRMWRPTNHSADAIAAFHTKRSEHGIGGVVCHALYLVNLAAPDRTIHKKSVAALQATVDAGNAIRADGVIFHVGSHLGAGLKAALTRTARALAQILERCDGDTWLLIENSAGTGGTIGRSLEELQTLLDRLDRHPRLGVCLDSCHLYASGYDVASPERVDELVREIDERLGLDRLRALHINDSATPLGSNRDRHADLLQGEMGEGLGAFLAHPELQHLSAYLETPGPDRQGVTAADIQTLRDLHGRWTA
jgi:deoxyribonuclease IV